SSFPQKDALTPLPYLRHRCYCRYVGGCCPCLPAVTPTIDATAPTSGRAGHGQQPPAGATLQAGVPAGGYRPCPQALPLRTTAPVSGVVIFKWLIFIGRWQPRDLNREAEVMVVEEAGSSDVGYGCGATSWLHVELVIARVQLQYGEDGVVECTDVVEEDSDGMERETAAGRVHFDAGRD
ncbi:hypothetical protein BHE74_00053247, partial [Ensete ventricosum]